MTSYNPTFSPDTIEELTKRVNDAFVYFTTNPDNAQAVQLLQEATRNLNRKQQEENSKPNVEDVRRELTSDFKERLQELDQNLEGKNYCILRVRLDGLKFISVYPEIFPRSAVNFYGRTFISMFKNAQEWTDFLAPQELAKKLALANSDIFRLM
jgi:hypothetical protein